MNARVVRSTRRVARRMRNRFAPRAVILLYHRVAVLQSDPWSLSVTPEHFSEHMAMLRARADPVPLQELVNGLRAGRLPRRAVAVTFDDGYADTFHAAKPVLDRHSVPATVFLPSGQIGASNEFWWDELDRILLEPGELPACLQLVVNGVPHRWGLGEAAVYRHDDARRYRSWRAWREPPTGRHEVYQSLYRLLQRAPVAEQQRVLAELRTVAGSEPTARSSHRVMTWAESNALVQDGSVEPGAHTLSHPVLAALDRTTQRHEIQQCKSKLETMLGRPVTSFAYPFGRPGDVTADTVAEVEAAGFCCACVNVEGTVAKSGDPLHLPRLFVPDWDGERFGRWLSYWLDR